MQEILQGKTMIWQNAQGIVAAAENFFEKSNGKSGFKKIRSFLCCILSSSASGDGNRTGAEGQPAGFRQAGRAH